MTAYRNDHPNFRDLTNKFLTIYRILFPRGREEEASLQSTGIHFKFVCSVLILKGYYRPPHAEIANSLGALENVNISTAPIAREKHLLDPFLSPYLMLERI